MSKEERITWANLVKKMKIGDTLMVKGGDGTIQELRFDGFKEKNGILDIELTPLALEFIEKKTD